MSWYKILPNVTITSFDFEIDQIWNFENQLQLHREAEKKVSPLSGKCLKWTPNIFKPEAIKVYW